MNRFALFILVILAVDCSSPRTCRDWANTTCSYVKTVSNEPGNVQESTELIVMFPRINRKASKNASCDKQYPDPFPLSDSLRCKRYRADLGDTQTEPKIEDVNGTRVYSCVSEDGTPLVSYMHGSKKATFNMSNEVYEQDCQTNVEVDEY